MPTLAELALRQHGVFAPDQLEAIGISRSASSQRVTAGRLFRIHAAVYSLVPPNLLTPKGRYMAAVLACGPSAVLSHRSAAALHGLRNGGRSPHRGDRARQRHPRARGRRGPPLAAPWTRRRRRPRRRHPRDHGGPHAARPLRGAPAARGGAGAATRPTILQVLDLAALADQLAPQPRPPPGAAS